MSDIFRDPRAGWTLALVVILPLLIIGIGEVEERLRQRDSKLQRSAGILRTWVVPLFAAWTLLRVLFDAGAANGVVRVVASVLVISLAAAALTAVAVVIDRIVSRPRVDGGRSVPRLLLAMPRLLIVLTTAWMLLAGVWAVDLSAALTALGVTSLIVSFALQDTLGGIASGFTLLADQPFQPGDWISTGDLEGRVVDTNWRSSRLETRNGDLVVVPNGQLAKATITNYDEPTRLHRVVVELQVAYANAPTRAKDMLLAAAAATPGVLEEPPPNAVVIQIDDPLMGYAVHMWIDDYAIAPRVRSDFGSLVWYHSHRFDVPLPSPAQDLYLWDGPRTAIEGVPDHAALLRAIRTAPVFADLPDDELDRLASSARIEQFATGESVAGEDMRSVAIVLDGSCRLVLRTEDGDRPVLDYQIGDIIGVVEHDDASVATVALTDCRVVVLAPDTASGAISRQPALSAAIDQVTSSRRRRVQRVVRRREREAAFDVEPVVAASGDDRVEPHRADGDET